MPFQKGNKINLGIKRSEDYKRRMKEIKKGNKSRLGCKHTEEAKRKIGEAERGEKHWNWQGGISFNSYSIDWTECLRRANCVVNHKGTEYMPCIISITTNKIVIQKI